MVISCDGGWKLSNAWKLNVSSVGTSVDSGVGKHTRGSSYAKGAEHGRSKIVPVSFMDGSRPGGPISKLGGKTTVSGLRELSEEAAGSKLLSWRDGAPYWHLIFSFLHKEQLGCSACIAYYC